MSDDIRIDVLYGHVELHSLRRELPDGSIEFGCRVLTYDNKPSELPHLASDKTTWGGMRLYYA